LYAQVEAEMNTSTLTNYLTEGVKIINVSACGSLIALSKPANVVVHPNLKSLKPRPERNIMKSGRYDMQSESFTMEGGERYWLLNRLDKGTSGLFLMATDADVARSVKRSFENRQVQKTYKALTFLPSVDSKLHDLRRKKLPWTWKDSLAIVSNGKQTFSKKVDKGYTLIGDDQKVRDAESSLTNFELRFHDGNKGWGESSNNSKGNEGGANWKCQHCQFENWANRAYCKMCNTVKPPTLHAKALLLELMPHTGLSHQLRVQCAQRGFDIIGDRSYGDFKKNRLWIPKRLYLHSEKVSLYFLNSLTGMFETFEAEDLIDEDFRIGPFGNDAPALRFTPTSTVT